MSDVANVSETLRIAEMELARIYEISSMDFWIKSKHVCTMDVLGTVYVCQGQVLVGMKSVPR